VPLSDLSTCSNVSAQRPYYSIMLVASASNDAGIVRPSVFAVFRLITNLPSKASSSSTSISRHSLPERDVGCLGRGEAAPLGLRSAPLAADDAMVPYITA
jgi:hypothetical protein